MRGRAVVILFFGEFLVELGLVQPSDLKQALERQAHQNRRLGALAVDAGLLTAEQVRQIHLVQQHDDRLFGEVAVALGVLTEQQIDDLRVEQKQGHLRLGEALVEQGAITVDELAETLRRYAVYQQQSARDIERSISETAHPSVLTALVGATRMMLPRCGLQGCKVAEVRVAPHATQGVHWSAFLDMSSDGLKVTFGLGVSETALEAIARSMGHAWDKGANRESAANLGEFVRFVAERASLDLDVDELEVGDVEVAQGDGFKWVENLIAERDFTQVSLALAVPGVGSTQGVLTVATVPAPT